MITASPLSEAEKKWLHNFIDKLGALDGNGTLTTAFLDPRQLELAEAALRNESCLSYTVFGGYPEAERNLLQIFPAQHRGMLPAIEAVKVCWNGPPEAVGHRDLLGAVLTLGLKRDQVGDILVTGEQMAVVLVVAAQVGYISANLVKVGHTRVICEPMALDDLPLTGDDGREIKGTVASLRLDSVVSLGFRLSRSRVVILIKGGLARVNWRPVNSPAYQLREGDLVSIKGRGRLMVSAIEGETRKGRIHLQLKKYG